MIKSRSKNKGGPNGQEKPSRIDTTLASKLDVIDELTTRFNKAFAPHQVIGMLDAFRKELLEKHTDYVVEGNSDVVGSDEWYLAQANRLFGKEGKIEVDANAVVSRGADPGAYVQAWVWVHNDEEDK